MRCKAGELREIQLALLPKHLKAGWLSHKVAEELTRIERHKIHYLLKVPTLSLLIM